jgi:hypothetical protein
MVLIKFRLGANCSDFGIKRMPTKGSLWNPGRQKVFRLCGGDEGSAPSTAPPFEKGGRKLQASFTFPFF